MWNVVMAQAEESPPPAGGGTSGPAPFLGNPLFMIVVFFAIMYFLILRPNQRREKDRRQMLSTLAKNDRVVTSGGICGTVVGLSDKTVVLRVDDENNYKIEFLRGAVSQVVSRGGNEQ